jgi:hypothetical protein
VIYAIIEAESCARAVELLRASIMKYFAAIAELQLTIRNGAGQWLDNE